jgi:glucokinase
VFGAGAGDPQLSQLITEFTDELAFHLVNLAILVNPARIAVGGGLVRSWDRIEPRLTSALNAGAPFPPELVVAHFPYDAPLLGAVALAVDAAPARSAFATVNNTSSPLEGLGT